MVTIKITIIRFMKQGNLSIENQNIAINKDKDTIYSLFDNFQESKKIYYTFNPNN